MSAASIQLPKPAGTPSVRIGSGKRTSISWRRSRICLLSSLYFCKIKLARQLGRGGCDRLVLRCHSQTSRLRSGPPLNFMRPRCN
jgi:hypothetical protein